MYLVSFSLLNVSCVFLSLLIHVSKAFVCRAFVCGAFVCGAFVCGAFVCVLCMRCLIYVNHIYHDIYQEIQRHKRPIILGASGIDSI